jgi:release factor glutamine methyltransferase
MAAVSSTPVEQPSRPSRAELTAQLRAAGCVFAEDEARLLDEATRDAAELIELVARRVAGEPLEPLIGWVEFDGLRLAVAPGVFVPRQRTRALAREAARLAALASARDAAQQVGRGVAHAAEGTSSDSVAIVVDLCCGVGAIAAVVGATAAPGRLVAADLDPVAAELARENLAPYGGEAYAGDLYDALPADLLGRVDVLAVNAPYVPSAEIADMPREAREYEPGFTLDGGPDGLEVHRRVAAGAGRWLAPGASVLIETGEAQADRTAAILRAAGFATRILTDDDLAATVVIGSATR